MDLTTLATRAQAELRSKRGRAMLHEYLEAQGYGPDSKSIATSFVRFIRVAAKVARSIGTAAARRGAEPEMKRYAEILTGAWSNPPGASDGEPPIVGLLHAAYFTLRSFVKLAEPTTPAARAAGLQCAAALTTVAWFMGTAATERLNAAMDEALASGDVRSVGRTLRRGAGSMTAWRYVAELPPVPPPRFYQAIRPRPIDRAARPHTAAAPPAADVVFRGESRAAAPAPTQEADLPHLYDVWFGTNRAPLDAPGGFSNLRDPQGRVHHGICSVEIPRTHKFGSTGTPFWKRWLRLEFTDDHLRLRKVLTIATEQEFLARMREELESQNEADRVVLVYLHGYNTSFESAALRAAQIGFDLKVPGVTAFYSWPSMGRADGYPADIARIEASEEQIADFLVAVARQTSATRVHVIAHSMANRGFARAVARITSAAAANEVRFGQIILAAPDIDVDLFKKLALVYPKISDRTTMYVSAKDKALALSKWLQDSDRAGFIPPVTVLDGIDTIEVTGIDLTLLGHGYFAEAEPILYDIKELMEESRPPERRLRIDAKADGSSKYWVVRA